MRSLRRGWLVWVCFVGAACSMDGGSGGSDQSSLQAVAAGRDGHGAMAGADGFAEQAGEPAAAGDGQVEGAADVAPSFADVYAIVAASCGGGKSGCHVGGAPAMLAMPDADTAYANLVGVASSKCPDGVRVVAGDPDESVLVGSLEGTLACVSAMPRGRDPLPAEQLAMIRAWIAAGASAQ